METMALFEAAPEARRTTPNPCVYAFGRGPEGATCSTCVSLRMFQRKRRWYKCSLRAPGGPSTDHRIGWEACAKYIEKGHEDG